LPQYNKTKLFRLFRLPSHQEKYKLSSESIKTIKSIIIISIFVIYLSMAHLTYSWLLGHPKCSLSVTVQAVYSHKRER